MWIAVLVSHLMMAPVNRRPAGRAPLQRCRASPGKHSPEPTRRNKPTMSKQAMVANANRKSGEEIETDEESEVDRARPEPQCEQASGMQHDNKKAVGPVKPRSFRRSLMWLNCLSGEQKYP